VTKRIESPVKKWPGHILLYDPIPLVNVVNFEKTIQERVGTTQTEKDGEILSSLLPCVAEWHLDNFPENVTVETFPGTPRRSSAMLIAALINAIVNIYKGDEEADPNV